MFDDTIAAVASAPGGAARGIVRLSGGAVLACLQRCFRPARGKLDTPGPPRQLAGQLDLGPPWGALPGDLYWWPTPRSYTRQPAAEFHTLGSPPLLEAALAALCRAGARLAQPGEFTLRAFLAGRLDLTQAEAVLGVIDARGGDDLRTALAQLAGGLSTPLNQLREQLLDLLAHLEAGLDFVEEDIEFITAEQLTRQLASAAGRLAAIARQLESRGEAAADVRVVLVGWPNVGKSSLFNALAGRAAAIVSDQAGTTRDYLATRLNIHDSEVLLVDTAGIAQTAEAAGAAAQEMAGEQSRQAHLRLLCLDATRPLNAWERGQLRAADAAATLVVWTKCDAARPAELSRPALATSSQSGQGLDPLIAAIGARLQAGGGGDAVASTAARCRESLRLAARTLARAQRLAAGRRGEELVAAEVRAALEELGKVVGAVYTDDILDRVFGRFCIGK